MQLCCTLHSFPSKGDVGKGLISSHSLEKEPNCIAATLPTLQPKISRISAVFVPKEFESSSGSVTDWHGSFVTIFASSRSSCCSTVTTFEDANWFVRIALTVSLILIILSSSFRFHSERKLLKSLNH